MTRRLHHLSDAQKSILTKAHGRNDSKLKKPEQMCARMWMSHLAQLARRDLITREGRATTISPIGIAALRCAR